MEYWPGIFELEASRASNVYLVREPVPTLVDTGPPGALPRVLGAIRRAGVRPEDVRRIILTHNDVDHIGNAHALQRIAGAETCAHEAELPYITGARPRPGVRRVVAAVLGRSMTPPRIDRTLHGGEDLDGLIVVNLPGHTPGHIGLVYGRVLFSGDAIAGGRRPRPTPRILTWDQSQARSSIARIATLDVDLLLPGHGTPVNQNSASLLRA